MIVSSLKTAIKLYDDFVLDAEAPNRLGQAVRDIGNWLSQHWISLTQGGKDESFANKALQETKGKRTREQIEPPPNASSQSSVFERFVQAIRMPLKQIPEPILLMLRSLKHPRKPFGLKAFSNNGL